MQHTFVHRLFGRFSHWSSQTGVGERTQSQHDRTVSIERDADALAFPEALVSFARRLATRQLTVCRVAYDLLYFGSWTMEIGRGRRRVLLAWGGKEAVLYVSVRNVSRFARLTTDWRQVSERPLRAHDPASVLMEAELLLLTHAS